MKKIFLFLFAFVCLLTKAQKPLGIFGKQNSIGLSLDMNPFGMSRYASGRYVIPSIQWTRVKSRQRSITCELSAFSIKVLGNDMSNGDDRLVVTPYDRAPPYSSRKYHFVTAEGMGRVSGISFGIYRVAANWVEMGPLGSYHTWGLHATRLAYRNDKFKYYYENYKNEKVDTFYNSGKPSKLILSISLAFGGKTTIRKSNRMVWDYGIRFKIPFWGYYDTRKFFNGRDYQVFHSVKAYMASNLMMLYTGVHYAF